MTLVETHRGRDPHLADGLPLDTDPGPISVSLVRIIAAVLESWKWIALTVIVLCAVTGVYVITRPRTFTARVVLVTVSTNRTPSLGGLGAGLLNLGGSGVQATPGFVMRLMRTDTVLRQVALSPWPGTKDPAYAHFIDKGDKVLPVAYTDRLKRLMQTGDDDKDAGTIAVSVTHVDSSVARLLTNRLVDATISAFKRVSKAQATQLREAQDARVDSAALRLRLAEEAQVEFTRTNRSVPQYSELYVRQQQLERGLQLAQTVYGQAVSDRESAVAKELEETPALIVVDPVPALIAPNPRRLALKLVGAFFLGVIITSAVAIARSLMSDGAVARSDMDRLRRAVHTLPLPRRSVEGQ